jgi:hypothetical protein
MFGIVRCEQNEQKKAATTSTGNKGALKNFIMTHCWIAVQNPEVCNATEA